jgi:APA family basic amino acid/polyamine antiporter
MENKLEKKYGLFTAICMVVGIVIGSGIFFKAQDVLNLTGGDAFMGVLAWLIGGAVMLVYTTTFAVMATKYEKVNGMIDYAEATCGKKYGFFVGWFLITIYYPAMASVLAWVSARYTMVAIFGVSSVSPEALFSAECITIAVFYLIAMYFINLLSPKIAGKFQISTTIIKLIPIAFIAIVGTVIGLANGNLAANFTPVVPDPSNPEIGGINGMIAAISCAAFAYEGWIIATSINSEIKDSKKNLPIALSLGGVIIIGAYVLYYLGVLGLSDSNTLINEGTSAAFKYFGDAIAVIVNFLVVFSCLGTLNGLTVACTRGMYSLAVRNQGIKPDMFVEVDRKTNMPANSSVFGLMMSAFWFVYFLGSQFFGWFGEFGFDSSELPIITIYPIYVPMLICFMIKEKDMHPVKRFVLPILSIIGTGVMVVASIFRNKEKNIWYLIVFAIIMAIGALVLYLNEKKGIKADD